jgi:hypothetical protein
MHARSEKHQNLIPVTRVGKKVFEHGHVEEQDENGE